MGQIGYVISWVYRRNNVTKIYKVSNFYKIVLYIIFIIAAFGAFELGKEYGFIIGCVLFVCFSWFVLLMVKFRIIITNQYLDEESGRLGRPIRIEWEQITRISRIPFSFLWMYRIHRRDKSPLMIPNMFEDYQDLIGEIVRRAPHAVIDDSIKQFLEKTQNKQIQ